MERHSFEHELAGPAVSPRRTSTTERDEWLGESALPPIAGPACRRFAFASEPSDEEESRRPVLALEEARVTDEVSGGEVNDESVVPDDHTVDEDPWAGSDSAGFETTEAGEDSSLGSDGTGFEALETDQDRAEIAALPTDEPAPFQAEDLEGEPDGERRKEVFSFVEEDHEAVEEVSTGDALEALAEAGTREVLEGIADRLEGVADRLRSSSLDELLRSSENDPLALLLTGFVLGASQRRSED